LSQTFEREVAGAGAVVRFTAYVPQLGELPFATDSLVNRLPEKAYFSPYNASPESANFREVCLQKAPEG
jgi:hypothetical protein